MTVIGLDPGPVFSAYVVLSDGVVKEHEKAKNEDVLYDLLRLLGKYSMSRPVLAIEQIQSFGMKVGSEVFETCFFSGRAAQLWLSNWPVEETTMAPMLARIPRRDVKLALCNSARAKDGDVRRAIMERFGGSECKGTKAAPGPLYGIKADEWQALGVCLTFADREAK